MTKFDHISGNILKIDDAKIYFEILGEPTHPVLLFLHGSMGNIEDFNPIISDLSNEYRLIGIDCRGHGKSTLGSQNLTYELMQKDIERVLDHLNIDRLSLIGFSNGGTVSYRLAAFSELKVDRLCTIGAPWCSKHIEHLQEAYSKIESSVWKASCPGVFEKYLQINPEPDFENFFKRIINMGLDNSVTSRPNEHVNKISCPTLVLRGERDPLVSNANNLELKALIKDVQVDDIPSAGHSAIEDQPQIVSNLLQKFFLI